MKKAIEEYFPIVEINKLAVPERNSFKPIYQMHKWFARRASSVFRAILLGATKPAGTDIMAEFYKDHTNDSDTKDKVILDPFMGGGTTVVEALRLGCKVIGIDLNPVAWFIVKTEVEPVDIEELKNAFDRLSNRKVDWSGKPLKETLLDLYKTVCPACGNKNADIIYTFWVKSAPCTTANCTTYTPLFSDYVVSQKKPSIRYFPDCACPECKENFDWEKEPAALVGEEKLMIYAQKFSAGEGRTSTRWAFSYNETVKCPWCNKEIKPKPKSLKLKRKKVDLSILLCPSCEEVWQFRGPLPEKVECPICRHKYHPMEGNIPDKGEFVCRGTCNGNKDKIIAAIRTLPEDQPLPTKPYAIEGYCEKCAPKKEEEKNKDLNQSDLFEDGKENEIQDDVLNNAEKDVESTSIISKNKGKFIKRISSADFSKFKTADEIWEKEKVRLPYPKSEIPIGEKTKSGLISHHYYYWWQMFNSRQLLALSTLLKAIDEEENQVVKEMLLSAYQMSLEANNMFARYRPDSGGRSPFGGIFSRHDFQPKVTPCEINVLGPYGYYGTYLACFGKVIQGKEHNLNPYDRKYIVEDNGSLSLQNVESAEKINGDNENARLLSQSSAQIELNNNKVDFIVTDPPYAGNVNYSELADFFYVWLRLILKKIYPQFSPEFTPKIEEVVENRTRGKSAKDFQNGLIQVFNEAYRVSKPESTLIFTFHHSEGNAWESLLSAVCNAGYFVEAVYPIHGESESSMHLMDNEAISYDLIHVCKKRLNGNTTTQKRSWAGVRHEIRQRAREEARLIEKGRYGNEPLSASDINILLIGKCLELYSKHYGAIVDHEDQPVPIKRALEEIKVLIDQIITKEKPLPTELSDIDIPSYIYFTTLCEKGEIKSDDINKSTRGIIEPAELHKFGLVRKGREKGGRTIEVKQPIERLDELREKFKNAPIKTQTNLFDDPASLGKNGSSPNGGTNSLIPDNLLFVDYIHYLLGLAEAGENIFPWVEKFRGLRPQIQAACEYLILKNKKFEPSAKKILGLIDERSLFFQKG